MNDAVTRPAFAELYRRLIDDGPLEHTLGLRFDGLSVRLSSNEADLVGELRGYYGAFVDDTLDGTEIEIQALQNAAIEPPAGLEFTVNPPGPGKTKLKEEFIELDCGRLVRKRLTGMLFLFDGRTNLACGPCRENPNQVINFINNRYSGRLMDRGALLLHAAGVARGGCGLALAGVSGAGKSSLALQLLRRGLDYISNDRLLLDESADGSLELHGVPKLPRINPGTALNNPVLRGILPAERRREYAELSPEELWEVEEKYDVFVEELFGRGRFRLRAPFSALVILNWRRGGGAVRLRPLELMPGHPLLPAFTKRPGVFHYPPLAPGAHSDSAYLERLAGRPVYELVGGIDFERAAELCLELLE